MTTPAGTAGEGSTSDAVPGPPQPRGLGLRRMVASLVRQRRRLALATLAVALGVGYLAGALTLLDRVAAGLDNLAAAGAERADLVIEGDVAYESALEQTRRLVPSSITGFVEELPGVAAVMPRVEEITVLLDAAGDPVVAPGLSEQPLGTNWPDDELMSPYRFVGEGRAPDGPDEVVIDERSARAAGVDVGDDVLVVAKAAPAAFEVTGIVTTAEGELPDGASLALFRTDVARQLFAMEDNDNRIAVRVEEGADVAAVQRQIQAVLPPGAEVVDGATGTTHRQESLTRSFALVRVLIVGFAGLALVVGMITVANSLTLLYAERRRTFAALRLVGAQRHQLMTAALVEAAMLAGVASLAGVPLGLLLARAIEAVLGALGTSVPVAGSVISPRALVWAVLIGVVATVLAAVAPALRACSVAPIDAVADQPAEGEEPASQRILNAFLVSIGAASLLAGLMVLADVDGWVALGVAVAVVAVWTTLSLLPWALSMAVAAGILAVPTRPPALRRIGARDAVRNRSRTAATTGALLLATAVVAGLAVFLASFAASVDGDVNDLVAADLVVDSGTFTRGGLPTDLLTEVAATPGVDAVSGWQVGRVWSSGQPLRITGVDGAGLAEVLTPAWIGPDPGGLDPGGIALDVRVAEQLGVGVGDVVTVDFTSGGAEQLVVEGLYGTGGVLLGDAMIDRTVLMRQVPASVDIAALVALGDETAAGAVEQIASAYGISAVREPSTFVDGRADLLRGFERVIQWMLLFTLLQALVGVVNTLLLSVGERRREFGLLRVSGASRAQIHRLVLGEGIAFAAVGTVLGLVVGIVVAAAAIGALGRYGISGLSVPVPVLVVTAVAAMTLGVLAAVLPARWAAAVPPLDAVVDTGAAAGPGSWKELGDRLVRWLNARSGVPQPVPAPAPVVAPGRSSMRAGAEAAAAPPPFRPVDPSAPPPFLGEPPPETVVAADPGPAAEPVSGSVPVDPVPDVAAASVSGSVPVDPVPDVAAAPAPVAEPVRPHEPVVPADGSPPEVEPVASAEHDPAGATRPAGSATGRPRSPFAPEPGSRGADPAGWPTAAEVPVDGWVRPSSAAGIGGGGRGPVFAPGPRPEESGPSGRRVSTPFAPEEETLDPAAVIRLGEALEALDPGSTKDARVVLAPLARSLDVDEHVELLVQGWVRGTTCVVARTDRRVLVVVDRFPEPLVESVPAERVRVSLFGPPGSSRVSLAIVDGRRLLEVTGVRSVSTAAAMRTDGHPGAGAGARRRRGSRRSQYF